MESINFNFKKLFYLSTGLSLIVATILILKLAFPVKVIEIESVESLTSQIKVNWDLIRKPLAVALPSLEVGLGAFPTTTNVGIPIDLTAEVKSLAQGPFIYHFDCQNDGVFELETESSFQKKYTAQGLCQYSQVGTSSANVVVDGFFDYFQAGQEIKEKRTAQASVGLAIQSGNFSPTFSFCDVDNIEGTTQVNFKFNFTSDAKDPEGDEISYEWDFGDGNKAQGNNVEYNYKDQGFYTPKVKAIDSNGNYSSCVAKSLTILKGLSAFEQPQKSAILGRENPFIAPSKSEITKRQVATSSEQQ